MSSSTVSKLDSLVGLGSAKRVVSRLARGDIGAHAVLFYGTAGSGKHALAGMLAEAWLCKSPGSDGADGECRACQAFGRGNNSDYLLVSPTGPSRIIRAEQIGNDKPDPEDPIPVTSFFRTHPIASRNKVVVIEDAHRMNTTAANRLLKTLEEPHEHGKLILTTDSVGSVLPTILSRCLAVACELPKIEQLRSMLPDLSDDILKMSEGAPGRAASMSEKPETYERLAAFARSLKNMETGAALVAADEFKSIAESFADKSLGARGSNALALELLAILLARDPGSPPRWAQDAVGAHRAIIGNANSGIVFDSLFAGMLSGVR